MAEIGTPLLIRLACSRRLIPAIGSITARLFPLSADWLPAISYLQQVPHCPLKWISQIFWLKLLKLGFLQFKDKFHLTSKIKYQR
jgi:hypothetical protein